MKNSVYSGKLILVYKSGVWCSQNYIGMLLCIKRTVLLVFCYADIEG